MKGINKLTLRRKLTALLLAGSMTFALSSCSGHVDMESLSPSDVLEITDIKDLTTVDECIENDSLKVTSEELNIIEAAERLENYLDTIDLLSKQDFTGVSSLEPLTDEQCLIALSMSKEEIAATIEQAGYSGNDVKELEKKLLALKTLSYIYNSCLEWVHTYGQTVSLQYMMDCVKGAVADELDLPADQFGKVIIDERPGSPNDPNAVYTISVGEETYRVSPREGEIWNTIGYIYALQEDDMYGSPSELLTYRKALNYGKVTMAAGVNINGDKITAQNGESYIRKNYV